MIHPSSSANVRSLAAQFLAVAFGLVVCATSADAAEDGGARSVFGYGAGNRALAIGGAYCGIAEDGTAPVWNVGGLGRLQKTELVASTSSLYGLDIAEHYFAVAYPTLHWGVASLTLRRFSVSGIERRDDRNFLLSDDESDGETEVTLSYGRDLNPNWSVGGSLKLQHQSLAGFTGSGVGLDVGVFARPLRTLRPELPWASRVTWGIAVRNLLEPSLKLDRESVNDPIGVRSGFGYVHPTWGGRNVLFALDVEKTKSSDMELHTGLEFEVHSLLALRGGWADGSSTAGVGIRWHDATVDYVFESNDFDSAHRFGVSYRFGPTVEARLLAAQRAEEDEFRQRLAETFERRQLEQLEELLGRAEAQVAEARYDDALETIAAVKALDSGNEKAAGLEARSLLAKASVLEHAEEFAEASLFYGRVLTLAPDDGEATRGLARCRTESDRRAARTARIQELFGTALRAFSEGDLAAAKKTLKQILDVDPGDADARAMLKRTETGIDTRTAYLLSQARRFVDRGLLEEAESLIDQARALDSRASGLATVTAQLREAERATAVAAREAARRQADSNDPVAVGPTPVVTPKPPALSRKKREELADLYRRGIDAMEDDRSSDALLYWELVWTTDPTYENVADFLKREYLLRGLDHFSRGSLDDAIRIWEKALQVDPTDEKALGYLDRAHQEMNRTRELLDSERD